MIVHQLNRKSDLHMSRYIHAVTVHCVEVKLRHAHTLKLLQGRLADYLV